jgi:hypothetical protein
MESNDLQKAVRALSDGTVENRDFLYSHRKNSIIRKYMVVFAIKF